MVTSPAHPVFFLFHSRPPIPGIFQPKACCSWKLYRKLVTIKHGVYSPHASEYHERGSHSSPVAAPLLGKELFYECEVSMAAAVTSTRFGVLVRVFRIQAGLSPHQLSERLNLNLDPAYIKRLEAGKSDPLDDVAFYERLATVLRVSDTDIALLLLARVADTATTDSRDLLAEFVAKQAGQGKFCRKRRDLDTTLTQSLQTGVSMQVLNPKKGADSVAAWMKPERNPVAQGTAGERHPSKQPEQRSQAPKQGDIYDSGRERYNREHLQATAPTLGKLLLDAIQNPDNPLSQSAVRALGEFAQEAVRIRGISASAAAKEFKVPTDFLLRWAKEEGIISILSEGTGAGSPTYLDREEAQEAANIFREAKERGRQPLRLWRDRHEQEIAPETYSLELAKRSENNEAEKIPDRLVTAQEVSNTLHLPESTVWTWLTNGTLRERGRLWHAEPGGRSSPLVSMNEAEALKTNRPPMGRPPKGKGK
jgi:transcriptional regulator with XRE-family HTH domain/transposase